jgi:hypothetical protein
VVYRLSEVVYKVMTKLGHKRKAHVDQLKPRVKIKDVPAGSSVGSGAGGSQRELGVSDGTVDVARRSTRPVKKVQRLDL